MWQWNENSEKVQLSHEKSQTFRFWWSHWFTGCSLFLKESLSNQSRRDFSPLFGLNWFCLRCRCCKSLEWWLLGWWCWSCKSFHLSGLLPCQLGIPTRILCCRVQFLLKNFVFRNYAFLSRRASMCFPPFIACVG